MIGFSFKSIALQIIQGSIVLVTIACLLLNSFQWVIDGFKSHLYLSITLLLFLAFSIGVLIDFLADSVESIVIRYMIKPPIYHLLKKDRYWGITLAHKKYILSQLCKIAAKYDEKEGEDKVKAESYNNAFQNGNKETINYILQVAKNKAFSTCGDYQKEQIDSFFILYVFSRNLSLSLLISSGLLVFCCPLISAIFGAVFVLTLFSSYRYYLYYVRILLGSTFIFKVSND